MQDKESFYPVIRLRVFLSAVESQSNSLVTGINRLFENPDKWSGGVNFSNTQKVMYFKTFTEYL